MSGVVLGRFVLYNGVPYQTKTEHLKHSVKLINNNRAITSSRQPIWKKIMSKRFAATDQLMVRGVTLNSWTTLPESWLNGSVDLLTNARAHLKATSAPRTREVLNLYAVHALRSAAQA